MTHKQEKNQSIETDLDMKRDDGIGRQGHWNNYCKYALYAHEDWGKYKYGEERNEHLKKKKGSPNRTSRKENTFWNEKYTR